MNKKIQVKAVSQITPKGGEHTEVCITNHIIEMKTVKRVPTNLCHFRKLNKTQYIDLLTGEVCEYKQKQEIQNNCYAKNKAFEQLRRIINLNFQGNYNELHLILTYSKLMMDKKQLSTDFKKFWNKLKYRYPNCEYIAVAEPQQTGSWHMHVLVKNTCNANLFIEKDILDNLWQHGFTYITKLIGNDNIGAYFTALHKDLNLYENLDKSSNQKLIIKNARLRYYPPNGKLFTTSKGILKPKILKMTYEEAMDLVDNQTPCFTKTTEIVMCDNGVEKIVNTIVYQQFNFKRK